MLQLQNTVYSVIFALCFSESDVDIVGYLFLPPLFMNLIALKPSLSGILFWLIQLVMINDSQALSNTGYWWESLLTLWPRGLNPAPGKRERLSMSILHPITHIVIEQQQNHKQWGY